MPKEMSSHHALIKIVQDYGILAPEISLIQKDLDRLEALEKENKNLKHNCRVYFNNALVQSEALNSQTKKINKQLIISIYDSWTWGRVTSNGKRIVSLENKIKKAYWWERDEQLTFEAWLLIEYGSSYDSIIVCEDGGIEVLK